MNPISVSVYSNNGNGYPVFNHSEQTTPEVAEIRLEAVMEDAALAMWRYAVENAGTATSPVRFEVIVAGVARNE